MLLDLREIINIQGARVGFDYEPDLTEATTESVIEVKPGARASGEVKNVGGVLRFSAQLEADTVCICARCLKEFSHHAHMPISATLAEEETDGDGPDVFLLDGDKIDVDEIVYTAFILDTEQRMFCREDCKGICERCGADLNDGPCSCKAEIDPRLAVLGQFLENE